MRPLSPFAVFLLLACSLTACATKETGSADSDTPWITEVDSTGDTVRIRITGEIPASLVRNR